MTIANKLSGGVSGGVSPAQVFSADDYTGNAAARDIVSGLDMVADDGAVLILPQRGSSNVDNAFIFTGRGGGVYRPTVGPNGEDSDAQSVTSFNSDGFSLGTSNIFNKDTIDFIALSFLARSKFLDIVEYTGTGSSLTVAHNLGAEPDLMIVFNLTDSQNIELYNSAVASPQTMSLNLSTDVGLATSVAWDSTLPTAAEFTVGNAATVNRNLDDFIALLFSAQDDGPLAVGTYTGNGSATGPSVDIGWAPQLVIRKNLDRSGGWLLQDTTRSTTNPSTVASFIDAVDDANNIKDADLDFTSVGFDVKASGDHNINGDEYLYIAIRAE